MTRVTPGDKGHAQLVWTRAPSVGSNREVSSSYRFSGPFLARLLALGLAAIGVLVLALVLLAVTLSLPGAVLTTGVLLATAAVVVLGVLARRGAVVVRFDETGYRIRHVRGAGVQQAEWKQVEDVAAGTVGGARCVVLRLRDGRTSTVPVTLLAGRPEDFVTDLQEHLNRGHGYRRVSG